MAESFKDQVDALTGFGTTEVDALSDWLTAGAREVFAVLPPKMKEKCISLTELNASTNSLEDLDGYGEVISVTRKHADTSGIYYTCRKIPTWAHGKATDSSDMMYYGTVKDPVYYIYSNSLRVAPTTTDAQPAQIHHYVTPTVLHGAALIVDFPDEAEYLVVLYASCKALQRKMNDMNSTLTAIDTTAFAAIKADLDECLTIADDIHTEVGLAKVIAAELKTQTANSDNMETACDAINTALARIATYNWEDEDTFHTTSSQLTRVKDALDNAQKIIDDGANSPTGDGLFDAGTYLGDEEDVELVQGAIAIASSEIQRAQAHIAEWTTIIDGAAKEANGFVAEVQARAAFSGAKAQAIAGYIQTAQGYASEIQSKIGISTGYLQEAKIRMEREMQKYQWYQSQQVMLKQDYERGIQMLVGGGAPQPPARGERE